MLAKHTRTLSCLLSLLVLLSMHKAHAYVYALCLPLWVMRANWFWQLPLESLALQSSRILMLDLHTQVYVWSGRHVAGPDYQVYRDVCKEVRPTTRSMSHTLHRRLHPLR